MTIETLITRPCTLRQCDATGARDSKGNQDVDVTELDTVCHVQAVSFDQSTERGVITDDTFNVFFLPGEQVGPADEVITDDDGRGYIIEGEPAHRHDPELGTFSHIEAQAKRARGLDREAGS